MIATNLWQAKENQMYVPKYAQRDESSLIHKFILEHPFATLMTFDKEADAPFANHFPFLFEPNGSGVRLMSHMARSNNQWQQLEADSRVLVVFQGAHSYISPSIYVNALNVPTWNYRDGAEIEGDSE
jgi:transcriptional regulator